MLEHIARALARASASIAIISGISHLPVARYGSRPRRSFGISPTPSWPEYHGSCSLFEYATVKTRPTRAVVLAILDNRTCMCRNFKLFSNSPVSPVHLKKPQFSAVAASGPSGATDGRKILVFLAHLMARATWESWEMREKRHLQLQGLCNTPLWRPSMLEKRAVRLSSASQDHYAACTSTYQWSNRSPVSSTHP
jgi:hypothetical protein